MIVVDASVLLAWLLGDLPEPALRFESALSGHRTEPLMAPALLRAEAANALTVAARRLRITPAQARQAATLADDTPIEFDSTALSTMQLQLLAETHGLSAYDAQYLELAMRRGARLLTADAALRSAALRVGVEAI
jgi:predicted nucleic acid-binding protein